ncbi:MAG: hypothetical protein J6X30_02385 [Clostridia bacterium]|nr:hypothetical protein [Clostridia bacterium]
MELDTNPYDYDDDSSSFTRWSTANLDDVMNAISEVNKTLGFSESLLKKMRNTTALQGRQTEENETYRVTWTYHPDNGLEVLYEMKKYRNVFR